ncbi:MAG: ATP-dependent DNA helicase RecG [Alphaproteobacteria bacterium]|nr:ATP-dependent DNA helicase RecG [Alphaproteobacteria bacterium]
MKRELFDFLNTDLQFIKGVGPVLAARFNDVLGGRRVLDFLLHRPSYVRARDITENVMDALPGDVITIPLMVKGHKTGGTFRGRRRPTQILCNDKMGNAVVIQFFNVNYLDYWLKKLPIGDWRMISGKLERGARPTISHPDFIEELQNASKIPSVQAIYPAGEGLTQKVFANVRDKIFEILPDKIRGESDARVVEFFDALQHIHYPTCADDLMPNATYMAKLAYCELLAHQSAIVISRRNRTDVRNRRVPRPKKYDLMERFYSTLPFEMTGAQKRTCDEIYADMSRDIPMMRLVQGDVGSGKTIVALAAAVKMAETGACTALLAPTDTLAQQHYAKLKPMCDKIGIVCDVLTGRDKGAARREKLISLRSGRTRLVVGTHALFSADVEYRDLGLVIVDEQHRFGVSQREALRNKGANPDLLALSATPIPRTLSMTIYGDMDVSIINEKPAGRKPIKTTRLPMMRINELITRLQTQIASGARVFWVCPLVEESENVDTTMTAVVARHKMLCEYFPGAGLVHGQMDKKARDTVMERFADDNSDMPLLVATTVIEVGIDVPRASIIVIENAERFGLAALHQLRGRVGRGNTQSYCVLVFGNNVSEDGLRRLDVLCETDDGFVIAEQDLMMRGVGELMGTRQSGWIQYHFVDYREHRDLFKLSATAARDNDIDSWINDLIYIFDRGVTQGA